MKVGCKTGDNVMISYYLDSQCTKSKTIFKRQGAIPSFKAVSFAFKYRCPNAATPILPTCTTGDNSPSPSKEDGGSSGKPIKTDYAVAHTISLQGITATQFNGDPLIIKSFRQAIAILLGIPTSDIINLVAQSQSRRVLRDMNVQHRNLEKSGCR